MFFEFICCYDFLKNWKIMIIYQPIKLIVPNIKCLLVHN